LSLVGVGATKVYYDR